MVSEVLPRIDYASHPAYGGMLEPHPDLGRRALEILQPEIDKSREVEADRQRMFGYRYGAKESVGETLVETGYGRVQLAGPDIDRVEGLARPVVDKVRNRLEATRAAGDPIKYKTALEIIGQDAYPDLWGAVEAAVRAAGMFDITTHFFGSASARVSSMGLLVNQPDQDWANRLYRDLDVPAPPTAGFHIDSNGKCFVKAVLYLSDVGPEQGPFGLVQGSHRWDPGSEERIYRRAFDKTELIVRSAKKRRLFISLPEAMQVKAEFGGDMLDGSPEAEGLLGREIVALGPRGQLNLFDPEAIHRGGNVRSGERRVILVTARAVW